MHTRTYECLYTERHRYIYYTNMQINTFGTVKPSLAAIREFLKAFGQVFGISLLVHGAWLKSVTVFPACLLYRTHINDLTAGEWSTGQVYDCCSTVKSKKKKKKKKHTDAHTNKHTEVHFLSLLCLP